MAGWMVFAIVVAALLAGAGAALEWGLRRLGRPGRWVWVLAMGASLLLPFALRSTISPASETLPSAVWTVEAAIPVQGEGGGADPVAWSVPMPGAFQTLLKVLWPLASMGLLLVLALGYARVSRMRARWRTRRISGRPVLISADVGPAVVGVRRPDIVLPGWLLGWSRPALELVLTHEEEHLTARDTLLLAGGLTVLVLAPWNLVLWWQFHRLRLAVELDCDERVLRRGARPTEYGALLLELGTHKTGLQLPAAAVAEPASMLERRLRAMTMRGGNRNKWAGLAGLGLAGVLIGMACEVPPPTEVPVAHADESTLFTVVELAAEASAEPAAPAGSKDVRFGPSKAENVEGRAFLSSEAVRFGPEKQLSPVIRVGPEDRLLVGETAVSLDQVVAEVTSIVVLEGRELRVPVQVDADGDKSFAERVVKRLSAVEDARVLLVGKKSSPRGDDNVVVLVDGRRIDGGKEALAKIEPDGIARIEVFKDDAAADIFPGEEVDAVVKIYTTEAEKSPKNDPPAARR